MQRSDIRNEVRGYLLNTNTNQVGWTDAELNGYIDEAVFYIQQLVEFTWDQRVVPVVAGQRDYNIPDNQYQLIRTTFDKGFLPQSNEYELDRDTESEWRNSPTGAPSRFFMSQHNVASLYPTPDTSTPSVTYTFSQETGEAIQFTQADGVTPDPNVTFSSEFGIVIEYQNTLYGFVMFHVDPLNRFGGEQSLGLMTSQFGLMGQYFDDLGNLSFIYKVQPDTMTADSNIPQIHAMAQPGCVYYALMRAFAREGEFQDIELAQAWFNVFTDWMDSTMNCLHRAYPTRVNAAEPYVMGNLLAGRLQSVGPPSSIIILGNP